MDRPGVPGRGARLTSVVGCVAACLLVPAMSLADDVPVPVGLQAELLGKVVAYDYNWAARAGTQARVVIVVKQGSAEGSRAAAQLKVALGQRSQLGGRAHVEDVVTWTSSDDLLKRAMAPRAAVIYLAPGFTNTEVTEVATALRGADVLTVAAQPDQVSAGAVLGFDLVSGKPTLLVNLAQARRQNVAFDASVLRIMKVVP